jgi:hypothetical protein
MQPETLASIAAAKSNLRQIFSALISALCGIYIVASFI